MEHPAAPGGSFQGGRKQGWSPVPWAHSHPSSPQLGPSQSGLVHSCVPRVGQRELSWFCHLCSGLQGQSRQENCVSPCKYIFNAPWLVLQQPQQCLYMCPRPPSPPLGEQNCFHGCSVRSLRCPQGAPGWSWLEPNLSLCGPRLLGGEGPGERGSQGRTTDPLEGAGPAARAWSSL